MLHCPVLPGAVEKPIKLIVSARSEAKGQTLMKRVTSSTAGDEIG